MRGRPLADPVEARTRADVDALLDRGVVPRLGTVLMSDDPAAESFMDRKHERCAAAGVRTERVDLPADAPATRLHEAVDRLAADEDVTALFVQMPLPDHVDDGRVRARIPPSKDVDCLAPENLGRLVGGDPRVRPATTDAVRRLLAGYDVTTAGRDAVVVGRSPTIGRPLANALLARGTGGDATVTVCHTATRDLAAKTREADLLVTAAGHPRLVDGSMVSGGVTVVDVSANRVEADDGAGHAVVGDVDYESVARKADAITPVPGGVGPLTLACLLRNVVDVTAREAGVESIAST
ncbi:MAG: bifunctional 5,10-methylenetetrahydrofolate dehydrogenase/5,10-methenyltetrahydrofolate cyclohydrolase [Haloferacaceae archaeon]